MHQSIPAGPCLFPPFLPPWADPREFAFFFLIDVKLPGLGAAVGTKVEGKCPAIHSDSNAAIHAR